MRFRFIKISVCVVTYNQVSYISRCLQSIVDQVTDFDFELVVGDDCSTDGTSEIVRDFSVRYPQIVRPIFQQKNIGPYQNYIKTHAVATGDYVAHCDGDDFWLPGKLNYQATILDQYPNISAVFTNAVSDGVVKYRVSECGTVALEDVLQRVFTRNLCVHSSILERRRELGATGKLMGNMFDFEMYWKKHKNSLFYISPHVMVNYSVNEQGVSKKEDIIRKLKESLIRFEGGAVESSTLVGMKYDFELMEYFSTPLKIKRPSIIRAIKFGYGCGTLARLCAPTIILVMIKKLKKIINALRPR